MILWLAQQLVHIAELTLVLSDTLFATRDPSPQAVELRFASLKILELFLSNVQLLYRSESYLIADLAMSRLNVAEAISDCVLVILH